MPAILQLRRGTTAVRGTVTPAAGELFVDTTLEKLFVGDGSTVGGLPTLGTNAKVQASPGNPTGTVSATDVMMGLTTSITPTNTGNVLLIISGTIFNAGGVGDGATVEIRFGTGGAPANGAAASGTLAGATQQYVSSTTAGKVPFSCNGYVSGLTLATTYWLDVAMKALTGGTATITGVSISAIEL